MNRVIFYIVLVVPAAEGRNVDLDLQSHAGTSTLVSCMPI